MYKAYKFRMYPTKSQQILISKTFGCSRFVYNHFLDKCKKEKYTNAFDMCKELKNMYNKYPFLKTCDSCSLRCAIFNLEDAYQDFFAKRSNYPIFKNKYTRQSYQTNCIRSSYKGKEYANIKLDLKNREIKLPKLGSVKIRGYRNLEEIDEKIINATIAKETTGKYYVSIVVEEVNKKVPKVTPISIVGIDLGIKALVVTSNGEEYENPKVLSKYEKRIKRLQRKLSRCEKGSKNREKVKLRIARVYSKVKNARKHTIIEVGNKLVSENDIIVSEKLQVKEMTQNHNLAKSIIDASFTSLCTYLKWKSECLGKYYYQVDAYYPSSKTCNHCDNISNITNDLSVREWTCPSCGLELERDINASINIMYEGLKIHFKEKLS